MKTFLPLSILLLAITFVGCKSDNSPKNNSELAETEVKTPFVWEGANVYFLMTDRFSNGDSSNDTNFDRTKETAVLRGFMGGDLKGITQKINEGYFTDLGVNAIWFTPVVEQIHGGVDEGTGLTYGFHGYWTKDWTALDPNFGTMEDLQEVVTSAHKNNIRIVMDVVLNHTGPVTEQDPFWGSDWAREDPNCAFTTYENTIKCSLVENLPDILTESEEEVQLPEHLIAKWKKEGRYQQEIEELENYFTSNNLKKTPRNYIIKWLTDYVRELGIDAFRVDTTKHVEEGAWDVLREQAEIAFSTFKKENPEKTMDDTPFFMLGEVYNYMASNGRDFNLGDKKVDYFAHGFDNLINFEFKYDALQDYETLFSKYDSIQHISHKGKSIMNYATSHDDGQPFDKDRTKPLETATKLLLTPGLSQIYYGDESARDLTIEGTQGDATLRSFMNWEQQSEQETKKILNHWQKLGYFRGSHPAIGAGKHKMLSQAPYIFSRTFENNDFKDVVIVGLDLPPGKKEIYVGDAFAKAETLTDTYSGQEVAITDGKVTVDSPYNIVLLEE
ncbi:alpha-amlyase [Dokdonia sinensis]|uniref:Alpha-amlyase n=1 Tax=Dokdonia sinensis TaxID=2479847 RepID=A0A3M0GI61_9FLAO|nr:alpha-amylase family glycosyl hydrolase [Dokdonia sinensis]RMB63968.1 alpha-amlyase [Dokdonia sinensis]